MVLPAWKSGAVPSLTRRLECTLSTLMAAIGKDILRAAELLRENQLVAIPTETVYGLAANALDVAAVLKIYEAKGRPQFNPLIVHVKSATEMDKYAEVPPLARRLAHEFSPGPLTYVVPKKKIIPDIVTAGGESVALRVPAHPMARQLLEELDFPLAAPSANPSGTISPVSAAHVADGLGDKIEYILDGGVCTLGLESTVVAIEDDTIIILRLGATTPEMLAPFARVKIQTQTGASSLSPGLLKSHYAPKTRLVVGDIQTLLEAHRAKRVAVLVLWELPHAPNIVSAEILSAKRDLTEAAHNLFSAMRRLDSAGADIILAEHMPEESFGFAINDRLERASTT